MTENLNVFRKIQKSPKLFPFQRKREVTKIDKDGNKIVLTISYKIEFINSARFMAISLSNMIDNLSEKIHKI